jgi:hypothetical protein
MKDTLTKLAHVFKINYRRPVHNPLASDACVALTPTAMLVLFIVIETYDVSVSFNNISCVCACYTIL